MNWLRGVSLRWRLAGLLAIGFAILVASKFVREWDLGLSHDLGIAVVVAALLGLTVDFSLKAEVARDAFKATLGYILRPEFRNEVARITGYKFICESHVVVFDVKLLEGHMVEVTTSVERTIKNITAYPAKGQNLLHMDEWGFPDKKSEIIACNISFNGVTHEGSAVDTDESRLKWETLELIIGPSESFTIFSKLKEYRRDNDVAYMHFATPTMNPEIEVRIAPELDRHISFGGAATTVTKRQYADREALSGMYFPHQAMKLRW
jgi:hypothetical protein